MARKLRRRLCQKRFFRPLVEALEDRRLLAAVITVNSTADSNTRDEALTLREAILINNRTLAVTSLTMAEKDLVNGTPLSSDSDSIQFNIPAADAGHVYYKDNNVAGSVSLNKVTVTTETDDATISDIDPDWPHSWFSIAPTSPLPLINDTAVLDGLTQPGASANTNLAGQGLNSVLKIEVSGASAGQLEFGLIGVTGAGGTTVRGLVLNRSAGPKVLFESPAANNKIEGNFIGPDVSGSLTLATTFPTPLPAFLRSNGVFAQTGGNTIGGTTAESRNLISGNNFVTGTLDAGIALRGLGAPTQVQGNLIGTDRSGTKALGNIGYGILVDSPNNYIGGENAGNVISANQGGIYAASGNNNGGTFLGNWIGTDVSGTLDLGNAGDGVVFGDFAGGNQVAINTIAFNGTGVKLGSASQIVSRNSIFSNDGQGIVGPQTFPTLSSVTAISGATRIAGTMSGSPDSSFRLEFFASRERDEFVPAGTFITPGQLGEGKTFIAEVTVSIPADGSAEFSFDFPIDLLALPGQGAQPFVTATATDITDTGSGPANKTSEFSHVAVLGGPNFVVKTTADTGLGTLRETIINANLTAGAQSITFAIPATDARHFYYQDDGVHNKVSLAKIAVTTAATDDSLPTTSASAVDPDWPHSWFSIRPSQNLPEIIDTITMDGYTQDGSSPNALPALGPLNTVLKIELDGTNAGGDGLKLTFGGQIGVNFTDAAHSTIQGLTINRFGGDGIELATLDGDNTIAGNFIGTDVSGVLDLGSGQNGVLVNVENNTVIGGAVPASRNLISGNEMNGLELLGSRHLAVKGNLIGSTSLKTGGIGNFVGIQVSGSAYIGIGGPDSGEGNVVAFNYRDGVRIGAPSTATVAADDEPPPCFEYFTALASAERAGSAEGVLLANEALEDCLEESFDADFGAFIYLTALLAIQNGNSPGLAIDIGSDGVTANDGDNPATAEPDADRDNGPNHRQNFPVLTSALLAASTFIRGRLETEPGLKYRISFFANTELDESNHGEAEQYLGFVNVTTDNKGVASFTFESPVPVPFGRQITATATWMSITGALYETSELSAGIAVRDNPWHNKLKPLDVTDDGHVVAGDALEVINYINGFGSTRVPWSAEVGVPAYYDTDNDLFVAPNDVLDVINTINIGLAGEGEGMPAAVASKTEIDDLIVMLAAEGAVSGRRRKGSS